MWIEAYIKDVEGILGLLRRAIANLNDGVLQNAKDDLYYCERLLADVSKDLRRELEKAEGKEG